MVTLLDVAQALGIPVEGLEVAIDTRMAVSAAESHLSWERKLRISRMVRTIRVWGPMTEEQRDMLLQGAEYCPVENTLTTPVDIETTILLEGQHPPAMTIPPPGER